VNKIIKGWFAPMAQNILNLQSVVDITRQITNLLDLDQLLSEAVRLTKDTFDLFEVQILLFDNVNQLLFRRASSSDPNAAQQPFTISLSAQPSLIAAAARRQQVMMSNQHYALQHDAAYTPVAPDPDPNHNLTFSHHPEMAVPILLDNVLMGVLDLRANEGHNFADDETKVMQALANQVAVAIRNAQLFGAEQHLRVEMNAVNKAVMSLTSSLNSQQILEEILEVIFQLVPARDVLLFFYAEQRLTFAAGIYKGKRMEKSMFTPREGGLTNQVAMSGQMIIVPHMLNHPLYINAPAGMDLNSAILGIPLKFGDEVLGVMNIGFPTPRNFTEDELDILRLLAAQASIAIYNARLFEAEQRQYKEVERLRQQDRLYYEHLNELKDDLLHTTSHDLKNPIAVIKGFIGLIEESGEITDSENLLCLDMVKRGADQMLNLVTDLLDLAKLETGVALAISPTALNKFLSECVDSLSLPAQQKNIHLAFSPLTADETVPIDPHRMDQVVTNLLSNAVKYTPEGGHVTLSVESHPEEFIIRIQDTGYGIPAEDVPHLFERFYRVSREEHQSQEGTGLGLAIVKSIIEQHHGRIEIESALGSGSTFSIHLPKSAATSFAIRHED
jgi:signal transduction histidine kinase